MWISKKQNSAFLFKTSIGIMNNAFASGKTYFIEVLPTINLCSVAICFYLKYIKPFQL